MKLKTCGLCHEKKMMYGRQVYCGSKAHRTGCSWIMFKKHYGNRADWRPQEARRARTRRVERLRAWISENGVEYLDEMVREAKKITSESDSK